MAPRCWFFLVWWLLLMIAVVEAEEQAEDCSAKSCGNLTISDPFWLSDMETGRSCGPYDFDVTCFNSAPVLRSTIGIGFAIIGISYEEHNLRVVDIYNKNVSKFCHVPSWNTSVALGPPFKISPSKQNLILYNCTAAATVARRDSNLAPIRCGNESNAFVRAGGFYNGTSDYAGDAIEGCNAAVVPVLGSPSGEANASDYEQLISDGFLVTWDLPPLLVPARKFTHP